MKIVDFKAFLALPEGTLYHYYLVHQDGGPEAGDLYTFEGLRMKGASFEAAEEYESAQVTPPRVKSGNSFDTGNLLREARCNGTSVTLEYGEFMRYMKNPQYHYAVYEPADIDALAKFLTPIVRAARHELPLTRPADVMEEPRTVWDIDEWIVQGAIGTLHSNPGLAYAHFFFMQKRMAAWIKAAHSPIMRQFKLFVDYEGYTWRVTGASRLGDIWLSRNLVDEEPQPHYDRRITFDLSKLSNWRDSPTEPLIQMDEVQVPQHLRPPLPRQPSASWGNQNKTNSTHAQVKTSGRHYKHVGDFREGDVIHLTAEGGAHVKPGDKLYVRTK